MHACRRHEEYRLARRPSWLGLGLGLGLGLALNPNPNPNPNRGITRRWRAGRGGHAARRDSPRAIGCGAVQRHATVCIGQQHAHRLAQRAARLEETQPRAHTRRPAAAGRLDEQLEGGHAPEAAQAVGAPRVFGCEQQRQRGGRVAQLERGRVGVVAQREPG